MTKEQYSKAVAINSRIAKPKETLEKIKNTKERILYYASRNCYDGDCSRIAEPKETLEKIKNTKERILYYASRELL